MIPLKFLCLLLVGFAWQAAQAAPLYKWRDSAGRITYSSLPPPPGFKAEQLQGASQPDAEAIRQAEVRAKKPRNWPAKWKPPVARRRPKMPGAGPCSLRPPL